MKKVPKTEIDSYMCFWFLMDVLIWYGGCFYDLIMCGLHYASCSYYSYDRKEVWWKKRKWKPFKEGHSVVGNYLVMRYLLRYIIINMMIIYFYDVLREGCRSVRDEIFDIIFFHNLHPLNVQNTWIKGHF